VSIRSTLKGGGYGNSNGTSFAAPIVAGVAGLVLSENPALNGEQVRDVILSTADDLGPKGWDPGYGWGRVNAGAAVAKAATITVEDNTDDPSPGPSECPGDLNGDGVIGMGDLLILIGSWGPCADCNDCPADIFPFGNPDCSVNVYDLLALIGSWGCGT
jgi:subtilisin family serine protease